MIVEYQEFEVELLHERGYSTQSTDNVRSYTAEYSDGKPIEERIFTISCHGIRVKHTHQEREISSAIFCESAGATTIHEKSFFIDEEKIWICVCNKIYCLKLPDLEIEWYGRFDFATIFSINPLHNDFIIHGELDILRITREGEIKWRFSGRDIFVTQSGEDSFRIKDRHIEVKDWKGTQYVIDENGQEIK